MHASFTVKGDLGGMAKERCLHDSSFWYTWTIGTPQRDAIVERAHRQMRVRDLFNVQQTSTTWLNTSG